MRLLPPVVRPFVMRFGQTGVALSVGLLAMAAAPLGTAMQAEPYAPISAPVDAPVVAVARPVGPMMRQMVFEAPLKGYSVNSPYGMRRLASEARSRAHKGVDIAAPTGTPIYATAEGRVVRAGYHRGGYGNYIEIKHPNGMTSLYAHLSRISVSAGQRVSAEQVIGRVGSTGYSTGPHLHFEVRKRGAQINPAKVVGESFAVQIDPNSLRYARA